MGEKRSLYQIYKDLFVFLIFTAIILQSGIFISNYIKGFYEEMDANLIVGVIISRSAVGFISSLIVALPLILLIKKLNLYLPWGVHSVARVSVEFIIVVAVSIAITLVVYLTAGAFSSELQQPHYSFLDSTVIYSITNILFTTSLEGYLFYKEHKKSKLEEAILRDEIAGIKLDILKNQINQHFMFNSLNVLSGLLKKDPDKAEIFIQEFSSIYRYVLETIEQPLSNLADELNFLRSYIYLQQIRHGNSLLYTESVSTQLYNKRLPPLSLQTVLENSIKHNIVNEDSPLLIELFDEDGAIVVKNNYQPKISIIASTGLGQKNIKRRYQIICEKYPLFIIKDGCYIATLPLVE